MSSTSCLPPTLLLLLLLCALFVHVTHQQQVSGQPVRRDTWVQTLRRHSRSISSQGGQDGIILEILHHVKPSTKQFAELGFGYTGDPTEDSIRALLNGTNTYHLSQLAGWSGHRFDALLDLPAINLHAGVLTPQNVACTLERNGISRHLGYLHIDVDSVDLWLLRAILADGFRPDVLSVEYNSNFAWGVAVTVDDTWTQWMGDVVYGASAQALVDVATQFGYSLVHVEDRLDLFFVADDRLKQSAGRGWDADEVQMVFPLPRWIHPFRENSRAERFVEYGAWASGDVHKAREEGRRIATQLKKQRDEPRVVI